MAWRARGGERSHCNIVCNDTSACRALTLSMLELEICRCDCARSPNDRNASGGRAFPLILLGIQPRMETRKGCDGDHLSRLVIQNGLNIKLPLRTTNKSSDTRSFPFIAPHPPLSPPSLLINLPNLLLNIRRSARALFSRLPPRLRAPIKRLQRSPLAPRRLLLANDRLARHAVEDVGALGRQPLEVRGYVRGRQVGGRLAGVGFLALFFPARVEELDCKVGG